MNDEAGHRAPRKAVEIKGVSKLFGTYQALKPVSFDIYDNEFFTLLGPSGCGKTTLLRMMAGFEQPTAGQIFLHGSNIQGMPPHKRRVNTVFQSYALFPHMSVEQNIGFGLENLGWQKVRRDARVADMLRLVHMEAFARRKPQQLSGGQRQRVALARALAPEPEVLLLDEPLSALDLKLRQAMRDELRILQRKTGITFVFVTHDQEEALDMSDRICVLGDGEIQQLGTPAAIYEEPSNRFVADFIGETNFLDAEVIAVDGEQATVTTQLGMTLTASHKKAVAGQKAFMSIRPEKISLPAQDNLIAVDGTIMGTNYLGGYTYYLVETGGTRLRISKRNNVSRGQMFAIGQSVKVGFAAESVRILGA
ncbi:ABC transporter ATP-binding protein [Mesorhizobium sp.]|uniref:ABC transporter ATP-binding protein n=2 Tax=Mesorhizobium sp. TaxID=1871066 RepID=UPI000FE3B1E6|nr:ABC transporter ATP-binding protein [Mesorhizobium sp.]RWB00676.1 MAG: ABC transporter ATP-binding protein [Mesorhizobium sp.]RWB96433.1 MAG: ABC transporter ATP-binding protein [Mesorhizobium sp.]RWO31797.1 MAG: ABC transporter ATP-binding protein [Mesorhizobium sp.]RWP22071.1 MAG: ABC transporter ATP-binding protein [Mesorhizobium sp.]RWP27276.1 MAG: ABC transporter ATP-binding protein [Mesorhizobium sp.]